MDLERNVILSDINFLKNTHGLHHFGNGFTYFENKDPQKSLAIRKQANQLFAKKNHDEKVHEKIWKLYTKSIAYAINESEELAAGYANRSALLLHLKKYNECLLDIERALKITESSALKVKLYCRQSECCAALQDGGGVSLEKANFWLNKINDPIERKKLNEMIEKAKEAVEDDVTEPIKKEKEYDISCENNAMRISYNEKYGKHLVADRDISIGELVYIEKFYVTALNTAKSYAYCSHCLALCWATIPCDQCSYYLYCSEKCKEEAWQKYHDMECAAKFAKMPEIRDSYFVQFGLRALIMAFKEAGSIEKLMELTEKVDKCTDLGKRGLSKDGKFSADNFESLYSLSSSKFLNIFRYFVPHIFNILPTLAQNTNIFGDNFKFTNNDDLLSNGNVIFVATLFLRLSTISLIHAFEVLSANSECDRDCKGFFDCLSSYCGTRGMSLSIFTSLINHSCDNNVDKFYTNDGRVVYFALKPIKKNSQIFSSYYCKFLSIKKRDRQERLYTMFEFHCDCEACKNDWPTFFERLCNGSYETLDRVLRDKHYKTFERLIRRKHHRHSTKTIRAFIEDTELMLKAYDQPDCRSYVFLMGLCEIIEDRYCVRLDVPKRCKNNSNK